MPETAPSTTSKNPFSLVAYLLFHLRHSLEDPGDMGRAPRWVRIARARNATGSSDYIAKGVRTAIDGLAEALSYMVELTLDIREILFQTDAAKALTEVAKEFILQATNETFIGGINAVFSAPGGTGSALPASNPLKDARPILDTVAGLQDYIPDPDDVHVLGHELYRLLCIEQEPLPRPGSALTDLPPTTVHHVNLARSGKIRLLQWAFNQDLTVFGLGDKTKPEEVSLAVTRFGARRLWRTNTLPSGLVETWEATGAAPETVVEWFYDGRELTEANRTKDIAETFGLLEALGYTEPAAAQKTAFGQELVQRLRRFQAINGLALSGELDNPTLNRLLHLDFAAKNLARARPFDTALLPAGIDDPKLWGGYLRVVNPGAEDYKDEGLTLVNARYPYYKAGTPSPAMGGPAPVPAGGGWISDEGGDAIAGFVALSSRALRASEADPKRLEFDGGRWSEGEAASGGQFFFAARHTEPGKAGRSGPPTASIFPPPTPAPPSWVNGQPPPGAVSRLYQWLPLEKVSRPTDCDMYITATVMRRSLYEERTQTAGGVPDQGTIALEFYGADVFKGLGTPRPRNRSAEPAELRDATRRAAPWPPATPFQALPSEEEVARKRNWVPQRLESVLVPPSAVAVLLILEGMHTAGWDTDAYFDDVLVEYSFRKR